MNTTSRTAGLLLIAIPVIFMSGFTGLQLTFDYPDILRQPAGEVLNRFAISGADLHLYWYAMMTAALLMPAAAISASLLFWERSNLLAALAAGAGVLAGLVQALGLLRWVMLVPALATSFTEQGATELEKALAVSLFDAANSYLGMGVGEHLGYFFTGVWTAMVSALMFRTNPILAATGWVVATGVVVGMAEPYGVPFAGAINAVGYTLWAPWALVLGVVILRTKLETASP